MTDMDPSKPTDHVGLDILSNEECDALLAGTEIGRVAFVSDGDIVILPINYRYSRRSIVFRTAVGTKLEAAASHAPMAFEIDGYDMDRKSGWSVLVKGVARFVMDEEAEPDLKYLDLRPWAPDTKVRRWVRITPDEITGRRLS